MRADDDVFVGLARQIARDVVDGFDVADDVQIGMRPSPTAGKAKECGFRSLSIAA